MGCESSHLNHQYQAVDIHVIDPSFLKPIHQNLRSKLQSQNIRLNIFMNVVCYLGQKFSELPKVIVLRHQNLKQVLNHYSEKPFVPQLIVLESNLQQKLNHQRIRYIGQYNQLQNILNELRTQQISKRSKNLSTDASLVQTKEAQKSVIDLKILRVFSGSIESQVFILEQTLKMKQISFLSYNTLQEMVQSNETPCKFIIVDHQYHRQVIKSVNPTSAKVICYCQLNAQQESYDPQTYFISNNFQQIVNQISFCKSFKYPFLPLTKVFFYAPQSQKNFFQYAQIFRQFNFDVKCFSNIMEMLKFTRLYFSAIIFTSEQQVCNVQKVCQALDTVHRLRIIGIQQQTSCSVIGLRKLLKEAKRGYLIQKNVTKVIDIVDQYHHCKKFIDMKKELISSNISFRCYSSFAEYQKNFKFISPFIICGHEECDSVLALLKAIKSTSKIIVFCNKVYIDHCLGPTKGFAFISSHYIKVMKYIKVHLVMIPIILDENHNKTIKKQQQIKSKQHRISAIKWAQTNKSQISIKEDEMSFILTKNDNYSLPVKQICNDACSILQLGYNPMENIEKFKEELIVSVKFLIAHCKLNFPEESIKKIQQDIQIMNLYDLAVRVKQFFSKEKEIGICLNNIIKKIAKIDKSLISHIKCIFYLINLNFLGYYMIPPAQKVVLTNWSKQQDLLHSTPGSLLIFKNYFIMYQEGVSQPLPGCIKIELEVQYCAIHDATPSINSFFVHNGMYVFSPFSHLVVTDIQKQNEQITIHLKLKRQTDFLKYYYFQNVSKDLDNLFIQQLQKQESQIIKAEQKLQISKFYKRLNTLKNYRMGQIQKAVKCQKQLIQIQQEIKNFQSKYLIQLQFELANYLLKQNCTTQVLRLFQEINQNSPSDYIRCQVAKMISTLQAMIKSKQKVDPLKFQEQALQFIELKQQIQKEKTDKENIEIPCVFNQIEKGSHHKIQCLEIDQNVFEMLQFD